MIVEYKKEYKRDIFAFTENCFRELGKKFGFVERPNEKLGPGMDQWLIFDEE